MISISYHKNFNLSSGFSKLSENIPKPLTFTENNTIIYLYRIDGTGFTLKAFVPLTTGLFLFRHVYLKKEIELYEMERT